MKRLHIYVATAALAGALALTGCSVEPPLTHGTVASKHYDPAHDDSYQMPIYTQQCVGGPGTPYYHSCWSVISGYVPVTDHHDACWRLDLRYGRRTGSVCVSKAAWEKAKTGGTW
jgi:hypothetical protein